MDPTKNQVVGLELQLIYMVRNQGELDVKQKREQHENCQHLVLFPVSTSNHADLQRVLATSLHL